MCNDHSRWQATLLQLHLAFKVGEISDAILREKNRIMQPPDGVDLRDWKPPKTTAGAARPIVVGEHGIISQNIVQSGLRNLEKGAQVLDTHTGYCHGPRPHMPRAPASTPLTCPACPLRALRTNLLFAGEGSQRITTICNHHM